MLDTNICIHLIRGDCPALVERMAEIPSSEAVISTVTLAELRFGVAAVSDPKARKKRERDLDNFLKLVPSVLFDERAAAAYAEVRMQDRRRTAGALDKLIAAHAIAFNLTLVTNNLRDFRKFRPQLKVENWTAKRR